MPYSYALAQHGTTLATRPFAERLRGEVIEEAASCELVELDFAEVLSTSHSFADEFVAQMAEESKDGAVGFKVTVINASATVEARIAKALELRSVQLFEFA
ncbi:MAG TPA: STAS-like domain-containing protein [Solirubrobacterales bacterium]|nr:STAS-like domain-containing protein [Solirubrobacterales bacterium]